MTDLSIVSTAMAALLSQELTPPEVVKEEAAKFEGVIFDSEALRTAAIMKALHRRGQITKASQLWLADQVYLLGLWVTDDNRFETMGDWLDLAFEGSEVRGSFKTTLLYYATVIAPHLRRNSVTDPVTGMRISPDYLIAAAGWAKIGDMVPSIRQVHDEIEQARKSAPLSKNELAWLHGADAELGRRMEILCSWVVHPTMTRFTGTTQQNLDELLKRRNWRKSRTPIKPNSLALKRWAIYNGCLIIGDLSPQEVEWLRENRLMDVLTYLPAQVSEFIEEQ